MDEIDKYPGAMLGMAAGDALGTTLEFKPPGSFEQINGMTGGGPFGLEPGQWTDDTSMALCLAASLENSNGFDPFDQMKRYVRWYREGYMSSTDECFDIGNTTRQALQQFEQTREPYSGPTDEYSAGNGSLMRLAPVPLFYARYPRIAINLSAESSKTTHGAIEAVDACRYFAGLIIGALRGQPKEDLLADGYSPVEGLWDDEPLAPKIAQIANGSFKLREPPEIRGTGYVVECLEAALWAFYKCDDFRSGALLAVNLGDDADTTGAVFGQLAGAFYGAGGIPTEWRSKIVKRELIIELAKRMYELSTDI